MTTDEQKVLTIGALGFLAFIFLTGKPQQPVQAQGYSIGDNQSQATCLPCQAKAR